MKVWLIACTHVDSGERMWVRDAGEIGDVPYVWNTEEKAIRDSVGFIDPKVHGIEIPEVSELET